MIIKTTGPDSSGAEQCGTRQRELLTGQAGLRQHMPPIRQEKDPEPRPVLWQEAQ